MAKKASRVGYTEIEKGFWVKSNGDGTQDWIIEDVPERLDRALTKAARREGVTKEEYVRSALIERYKQEAQ